MSRLRLTIAQLMAIVLLVGFGFAAIRNSNQLWANAAYTLAFFMISAAPLGGLARKGAARMALSGFAVFGWARLLVGSMPQMTDNVFGWGPIPPPKLLNVYAFTYLLPLVAPSAPGFTGYTFDDAGTYFSLEIIFFGSVGAVVGQLLAVKDERHDP